MVDQSAAVTLDRGDGGEGVEGVGWGGGWRGTGAG